MKALLSVQVSRALECVTLAHKEAMSHEQYAPAADRHYVAHHARGLGAVARTRVAAMSLLVALIATCGSGCTQDLTALNSLGSFGGGKGTGGNGASGGGCATQACDALGQCCQNFECLNGRCYPNEGAGGSVSHAGPGQSCGGPGNTVVCGASPYPAYQFNCQSIEATSLCLSGRSSSTTYCKLDTDCATLHCGKNGCEAGPACGVLGEVCNVPGDCCSNRCENQTCVRDMGLCTVIGDTCNSSAECCSGNRCVKTGSVSRCVPTSFCRGPHEICGGIGGIGCCNGLKCLDFHCVDSCAQRDASCMKAGDCCSQRCSVGPGGDRTCVALDGCQPVGEKCTANADCCSNNCDKGRCGLKPELCAAEGEICSMSDPWGCCTGGYSTCTPDVLGVTRCSNTVTGCRASKDPCTFGNQCCQASSRCDYDPGASTFLCNSTCKARDESCTRHEDCCSNYCSSAMVCADGGG